MDNYNKDLMDKWRKRVIAAIAGYFQRQEQYTELSYYARLDKIKGTAMRIAIVDDFNQIPQKKLQHIYNEFRRK